MNKKYILIVVMMFVYNFIFAHLCDDVFIQAKDNLAVKIDVRDGQLRINDSGVFRVYLLNTMDRNIAEIKLAIISDEFDATVKPSTEWKEYPTLKNVKNSGKKEYFEVMLKRKPDVKSGTYQIKLQLSGGTSKFKIVDFNETVKIFDVPKFTNKIIVDSNITEDEWANSLLCCPMYQYATRSWSNNNENIYFQVKNISKFQSRYRFIHDDNNLYCLADFQKILKNDKAIIYISPDTETNPVEITIDAIDQTIECSSGKSGLEYKFNNEKVEIKIPYKLINLNNKNQFYLNIVRKVQRITTYWQGDEYTINDPVFYARLIIK